MIRRARFSDVPRMVEILEEAYGRTRYATEELCGFDGKEARRVVFSSIQRDGHKIAGGTRVLVAETGNRVEGFLIGQIDRVYLVGDRLMASDVFWLATDDVDPRDPLDLVRGLVKWARSNPNVIEVQCGATDVLGGRERAGRALKHLGLEPYGAIWRMELVA